MALIRIESEQLQIDIAPEAGASLVAIATKVDNDWLTVTRPTPQEAIEQNNPSLMASFTMAPWCNRIQDARFLFQGKVIELKPATPEGYAMHGDVRKRPWTVIEQQPEHVMLRLHTRNFADFNFPFPLVSKIHYLVSGNEFVTEFSLINQGFDPMPAGFGFHPYFKRSLNGDPGDEARLQVKVGALYPPMPSGPTLPIPADHDFNRLTPLGDRVIDAVYGGWDGRATIDYAQSGVRIEFECSDVLRHLCLFTPPGKPFFALEPLSHGLNGPNLFAAGQPETGMRVLEPGEGMEGRFVMRFFKK